MKEETVSNLKVNRDRFKKIKATILIAGGVALAAIGTSALFYAPTAVDYMNDQKAIETVVQTPDVTIFEVGEHEVEKKVLMDIPMGISYQQIIVPDGYTLKNTTINPFRSVTHGVQSDDTFSFVNDQKIAFSPSMIQENRMKQEGSVVELSGFTDYFLNKDHDKQAEKEGVINCDKGSLVVMKRCMFSMLPGVEYEQVEKDGTMITKNPNEAQELSMNDVLPEGYSSVGVTENKIQINDAVYVLQTQVLSNKSMNMFVERVLEVTDYNKQDGDKVTSKDRENIITDRNNYMALGTPAKENQKGAVEVLNAIFPSETNTNTGKIR